MTSSCRPAGPGRMCFFLSFQGLINVMRLQFSRCVNYRVCKCMGIKAWISNHIHVKQGDVITHTCLNFSGGFTKAPSKLGHGSCILYSAWNHRCNHLYMSESQLSHVSDGYYILNKSCDTLISGCQELHSWVTGTDIGWLCWALTRKMQFIPWNMGMDLFCFYCGYIYIYISNGLCLSTLPQRVLNTHMRGWLQKLTWFTDKRCVPYVMEAAIL